MTHLLLKNLSFPPGTPPLMLLQLLPCGIFWTTALLLQNSSAAFVVRLKCMQFKMWEQWRGVCKLCHPAWGTRRNPARELGKASLMCLGWQCKCRKTSLQEEAPSSFCPNTDFTYSFSINLTRLNRVFTCISWGDAQATTFTADRQEKAEMFGAVLEDWGLANSLDLNNRREERNSLLWDLKCWWKLKISGNIDNFWQQ